MRRGRAGRLGDGGPLEVRERREHLCAARPAEDGARAKLAPTGLAIRHDPSVLEPTSDSLAGCPPSGSNHTTRRRRDARAPAGLSRRALIASRRLGATFGDTVTTCGSCGRELVAGSSFCGYCGASTSAPDPGAQGSPVGDGTSDEYWVCAQCHVENPRESVFCSSCGAPVTDTIATAQDRDASVTRSGSVTCSACGRETEDDSSFCSWCGAPLEGGRRSPGTHPAPSAGRARSPAAAGTARQRRRLRCRRSAPQQDSRGDPDPRRHRCGGHCRRGLRRGRAAFEQRRAVCGVGVGASD